MAADILMRRGFTRAQGPAAQAQRGEGEEGEHNQYLNGKPD
jgi:hypothetical protein